MKYSDIDPRKTAFIFELDNVLYPEKDYLFQVYYLFTSFLEYTELVDAKEATDLMVNTYIKEGKDAVFNTLAAKYAVAGNYRDNFENLCITAKLPLKLLLYQGMLNLLQDIVVDRKHIFIVTNGNPVQQLNKIKQTEWNGLEPYLTCYFANETLPKPETDSIHLLIKEHDLQRKNMVMIGNSDTDVFCAEAAGIDYIETEKFIQV